MSLLENARLAQQAGRLAAAEQLLVRAVQTHPQSPAVWNDLGLLRLAQRQDRAAAESFEKAVALQPGSPLYRNNLGIALTRCGRVEDALKHFTLAVGEAGAHYNAGVVLHELGKDDQSAEQFRLALLKDPALKAAQAAREELGATPQARRVATTGTPTRSSGTIPAISIQRTQPKNQTGGWIRRDTSRPKTLPLAAGSRSQPAKADNKLLQIFGAQRRERSGLFRKSDRGSTFADSASYPANPGTPTAVGRSAIYLPDSMQQ